MVVAEVLFYDVVKWFHITSVVIAFGPPFAYGIIGAVGGRADPRSLPGIYAGMRAVDKWLSTIGAVFVLGSGIYLADDRWEFGDTFVVVGMIAIVVLLGLIHGVFIPSERRAEAAARRALDAGGEFRMTPELNRENRIQGGLGLAAYLIVIVTIYFMATKPFL